MGIAEASPATMALLLLRNLATSLFVFAEKTLIHFSKKHKLLQILHSLLISSFLFFLRLLPSINPVSDDRFTPRFVGYGTGGDLGISRALNQLLSIITQIPVSSRKYEVVRSLTEKLIDENHREGVGEVNRAVLSAAFDRTIALMEAAMLDRGFLTEDDGGEGVRVGSVEFLLVRVLRAVLRWLGSVEAANRNGGSAEKLAAEVLWLAGKMGSCGFGVEAVRRWAAAAKLGRLSLSAEPRVQGSLVRAAAFLFKQSREMGKDEEEKESEKQQHMQTKMKMLISWLPLLCRGSNGTDAPVLSIGERRELESVLEEMIESLEQDEQEQVLAVAPPFHSLFLLRLAEPPCLVCSVVQRLS